MVADFTRIKARVTEILNACDPGTVSATVSTRNKTRNATAIEYACYEAGLTVLQAIGAIPNEFRSALVEAVEVNHSDLLPEHLGQPAYIEIQRYSGAGWREAEQRNLQKIEAYRENHLNVYDNIDHDQEGSSLSGLADIWENKVYFTGYACRVGLATASRADVLTKIPDVMEPIVVKLAIGNCPKFGEGGIGLAVAQGYATRGENDLLEFKGGKRKFAEVSIPEPTSQIHR